MVIYLWHYNWSGCANEFSHLNMDWNQQALEIRLIIIHDLIQRHFPTCFKIQCINHPPISMAILLIILNMSKYHQRQHKSFMRVWTERQLLLSTPQSLRNICVGCKFQPSASVHCSLFGCIENVCQANNLQLSGMASERKCQHVKFKLSAKRKLEERLDNNETA